MMSANEIIKQAKNLKPQDKYLVIESLVQSLNEPNKEIETIWIEESQKRLKNYREGNLKTVSFEKVFDI